MPKTILFADDELYNIEGLIETVRAEGFEVLTCRDASSAVRIVGEGGVDCLVIDIMMDPGDDFISVDPSEAGLAAIAEILRNNPDQPIVCHSVISDQAIIDNLKRKGVLYLRKAETSAKAALKIIESKATGVYKVR